jgi:hypothetical protein
LCFTLENFFVDGLSAASCFIAAYTACAFCGFATVGANAVAVVDKVSAVYATRLIFFAHPLFASAIFTL